MGEDKKSEYVEVWQRFIKGDDDALSVLYFEFFDEMLNFGLKYTRDTGIVEDCIQDFFIELYDKQKELPQVRNIKFYFLSSVKHKLFRQLKRRSILRQEDSLTESAFFVDYSYESKLINEETKNQYSKLLRKCISQLSSNQKEAIYLRFNCGMDYKEISNILSISVASSRTLIYRSVKAIKDAIEKGNLKSVILFGIFCILPRRRKKTHFACL